jgi:hypothetical protein
MRKWRVGVTVCREQPVGPAQADQRVPGDDERSCRFSWLGSAVAVLAATML